jgi:hypothetical protein
VDQPHFDAYRGGYEALFNEFLPYDIDETRLLAKYFASAAKSSPLFRLNH